MTMKNVDYRPVYFCDFRTSDGATIRAYQAVRFATIPSYLVIVDDVAFKKVWEAGNRAVYVQVSITNISSQVNLNG